MGQAPDFKCALITGGAGGIGRAMAEYFLSLGKKVIICGRTESKLKETISEWRSQNHSVEYYVLDTGETSKIADFVKKITSERPELDCLINNAGVQRPLDVNEMSADEFLEKADNEINVNVHGPMHLAIRLLPHFKSKSSAVIINVSSVLGYIPTSVINPVYNGTKSHVHFWSMNLRTQLAKAGSNIKVIEIAPPTVSTDLHRERKDPNDNKKDKNSAALSVEEFMDGVKKALGEGKETFGVGMGEGIVDRWFKEFGDDYAKAAK